MTVRKYLGTTATITVTNRHSTKSAEEMRGKSVVNTRFISEIIALTLLGAAPETLSTNLFISFFEISASFKFPRIGRISYRLKSCLIQSGLDKKISFNVLRDSCLVRRVNTGENLSGIAAVMGYSSPEQVRESS